jgi:hypothetical protein
MKYKLKKNSGTYMYKKNPVILNAILAVQMLKFIGSFYWLYKVLNTHYEYKSTVHVHLKFDIVRCVFLLFCVLMKHNFICVNIVMQ